MQYLSIRFISFFFSSFCQFFCAFSWSVFFLFFCDFFSVCLCALWLFLFLFIVVLMCQNEKKNEIFHISAYIFQKHFHIDELVFRFVTCLNDIAAQCWHIVWIQCDGQGCGICTNKLLYSQQKNMHKLNEQIFDKSTSTFYPIDNNECKYFCLFIKNAWIALTTKIKDNKNKKLSVNSFLNYILK